MKFYLSLFLALATFAPIKVAAHCQLPCGIYHDDLEFALLEEAIQTINRANTGIQNNDSSTALSRNQVVRSVNLKEEYSDKISHIITFYFLQQRITPGSSNNELVTSAHQILVLAMKVKQTVDAEIVKNLNNEISNFKRLYYNN